MEFRRHTERDGLDIHDPIENVRFALFTSDPVGLMPADTSMFYFPVDAAVEIETTVLEVPKSVPMTIRRRDGTMVTETSNEQDHSFDSDAYLVELSTTPMKLYLILDSSMRIQIRGKRRPLLSFEPNTVVRVGARSYHDRPAGTITVTDDVQDVMGALSRFGSALKSLSPERSFPTLRGHPPLIERGDEFSAPAAIEPVDSGVELVIPPDPEYVYPIAPLAYYLGATVVPGNQPRLVAGSFEYSLVGSGGYVETVNRVLRQTFFLDCLTRTEGYYPIELHERGQVEPLVDLDFTALYDTPLPGRLAAYLSVPFETLEPFVPNWQLGVDLTPTANNIEYLPYLARDLALVRIPDKPTPEAVKPMSDAQTEFFRSPMSSAVARGQERVGNGGRTRHISGGSDAKRRRAGVGGTGIPAEGATNSTLGALRQRIDRRPASDTITIHVVCNDEGMMEENVVREIYGLQDMLDFDVVAHYDLSRGELADLLAQQADFIHYIGHVDENGFLCSDGSLDARSIPDRSVCSRLLLNACQSYEQGHELVKKGSQGGVVTLSPVGNPMATELGQNVGSTAEPWVHASNRVVDSPASCSARLSVHGLG